MYVYVDLVKHGVLTLVGEIWWYRNDPSYHINMDATFFLPEETTWSTATPISWAMYPMTEKMTNPPKKLVPSPIKLKTTASLLKQNR